MNSRTLDAGSLIRVMETEFQQGRPLSLTVTGSSMEPFLRHLRDQVVLVPPEKRKPRPGEIIFFRRDSGACVLHRILKKDGHSYLVCGDAQTWTEMVREEQILAVTEALVRKGRMISCGSRGYRFWVRLWMALRPLRKGIFALGAQVKRVFGGKRND